MKVVFIKSRTHFVASIQYEAIVGRTEYRVSSTNLMICIQACSMKVLSVVR